MGRGAMGSSPNRRQLQFETTVGARARAIYCASVHVVACHDDECVCQAACRRVRCSTCSHERTCCTRMLTGLPLVSRGRVDQSRAPSP